VSLALLATFEIGINSEVTYESHDVLRHGWHQKNGTLFVVSSLLVTIDRISQPKSGVQLGSLPYVLSSLPDYNSSYSRCVLSQFS